MFCPNCGAPMADGAMFCANCRKSASVDTATVLSGIPGPPPTTSGKAIGSLISGIIGLLFFPASVVAIILGHLSRSSIRKSNGQIGGGGIALTGLILGYAGIAVIPIVLIIAAIAVPNLLRARIAANESSAASSVRTLITAEQAYRTEFPPVGYTCRLASLGGAPTTPPTAERAGLIDSRLSSGQKSGYRFELRNCAVGQDGGKFQVVAYPLVRNQTGTKAFCGDESQVVKFDPSGSPDDCVSDGSPLE